MIESLLKLHAEPQQSGFPVLWYHLAPVCLAVPGPSSVNTLVLLCGRGLSQNRPEATNTGNNFSVTSQFVTAGLHHPEGTSVNFVRGDQKVLTLPLQWLSMRNFIFNYKKNNKHPMYLSQKQYSTITFYLNDIQVTF